MTTRARFILTGENRTDRAFRGVKSNLRGVSREVKTLAASFGLIFGAVGLARGVKSIAQAGIQMERLERTFRVATGSAEAAKKEFEFVRKEVDRLGADLETSALQFAKLAAAAKGTRLEGKGARDIFVAVAEASRVLGLSAEQSSGALTAIEQIISKGKVSAEELRGQLGERLPGAFQIAARAIGVTTAELDKMLATGALLPEELLPAMAVELHKTFGEEAVTAAGDAQAAFNRLQTAIFTLKTQLAESGLIDALARAADLASSILNDFSPESKQLRIKQELEVEITNQETWVQQLQDQLDWAFRTGVDFTDIQVNLMDAEEELKRLKGEWDEITTASESANDAVQDYSSALQEITFSDKLQEKLKPINPEDFAGPPKHLMKELVDEGQKASGELENTFARGIFASFDEGVAGMGEVFKRALQNMVAEAAAAGIVRAVFGGAVGTGGGGILGNLFGFQHGGSFQVAGAGGPDSQLVAFKATPGERVDVSPPGKRSGGVTVNQYVNIDATGAVSSDLLTGLPIAFQQLKEQTKAEMMDLLERPGMA